MMQVAAAAKEIALRRRLHHLFNFLQTFDLESILMPEIRRRLLSEVL